MARSALEVPLEGLRLGIIGEMQGDLDLPGRMCGRVRRLAGIVFPQPAPEIACRSHIGS